MNIIKGKPIENNVNTNKDNINHRDLHIKEGETEQIESRLEVGNQSFNEMNNHIKENKNKLLKELQDRFMNNKLLKELQDIYNKFNSKEHQDELGNELMNQLFNEDLIISKLDLKDIKFLPETAGVSITTTFNNETIVLFKNLVLNNYFKEKHKVKDNVLENLMSTKNKIVKTNKIYKNIKFFHNLFSLIWYYTYIYSDVEDSILTKFTYFFLNCSVFYIENKLFIKYIDKNMKEFIDTCYKNEINIAKDFFDANINTGYEKKPFSIFDNIFN